MHEKRLYRHPTRQTVPSQRQDYSVLSSWANYTKSRIALQQNVELSDFPLESENKRAIIHPIVVV